MSSVEYTHIYQSYLCRIYNITTRRPHCNTLQHTVTRLNTLQRTVTRCKTPHNTAALCNTPHNITRRWSVAMLRCVKCTAVCCGMLQCVAACCSVWQRKTQDYKAEASAMNVARMRSQSGRRKIRMSQILHNQKQAKNNQKQKHLPIQFGSMVMCGSVRPHTWTHTRTHTYTHVHAYMCIYVSILCYCVYGKATITECHVTYVNCTLTTCGTYVWVMPHMKESCHMCMSHVTCEWVLSHVNKSCHMWMSHVICEWVMSYVSESCHMWMSHVTCEWVMSHVNDSCPMWMNLLTVTTPRGMATISWLPKLTKKYDNIIYNDIINLNTYTVATIRKLTKLTGKI